MSVRYSKRKKLFIIETTAECFCDSCDEHIESDVTVEVSLDDILNEVDIIHLSKALSSRKLYLPDYFSYIGNADIRRMLCDMVET